MNTSEPRTTETQKRVSDQNIRRAHMLLGSFWAYNVLRGHGILETTLDVLKMQGKSVGREQFDKLRGVGKKITAKSAVKAGTAGLLTKRMQFKLVKRILKSARVI